MRVFSYLSVVLCLASGCKEGVRVAERFGFDAEDSATFLQAALDSGAPVIVLEDKGSPWISSKPLVGRGNQTIVFEKGAWLEAKRGYFKGLGDMLLKFVNCTNVTLRGAGPEVCGLRMWHDDYDDKTKYRHSEWRHGLALYSCVNVRIEGLAVNETGGDGLYVASAEGRTDFEGRRGSRDITVKNCIFNHNNRQGISVIGVDGLLVEDVRLTNTQGAAPEAGIDFEPNRTDQCLRNIVLRRCHIEGNAGNGIELAHGHFGADTEPNLITVEDCLIVGNKHGFYYPTSDRDADKISDSGSVTIRNTTFRETRERGVCVGKRVNCKGSVTFENCRLENCGVEKPDDSDLSLSISGHNLGEPDAFYLRNLTVIRPKDRPLLRLHPRKGPFRGKPTVLDGEVLTVTAGKEERQVFDAAWRAKNCPYVDVKCPPALPTVNVPLEKMRVTDERPGEMLPCAPAFQRERGRYFVFYAKKGECARFRMWAAVIGKRTLADTKPIEVYARDGKDKLATFEPPRTPKPEDRTFVAPKTGFYEFFIHPAWNAIALTHCNVPVALDSTRRLVPLAGLEGGPCAKWIANAPERLQVRVPAGKAFECDIACSVGENVAFELSDPSGSVVTKLATVEGVERFQAKAEKTSSWGLRFGRPAFGAFEDFQVGVKGVPGWIFLTADRYWEEDAKRTLSDAERMHATEMNKGIPASRERIGGGGFRVLIYGNSIAHHRPSASIGWTNSWGMAASSLDRDFASLTVEGLEERLGKRADYRVKSLYRLECDPRGFDVEKALADDVPFKPDYVIVALGENVKNLDTEEEQSVYRRRLEEIACLFRKDGRTPKILFRSPFWKNPQKMRLTREAAEATGSLYVDAGPLGDEPSNMALGLFKHAGVARHPGDLGMRRLADLILSAFDRTMSLDVRVQQTAGGPQVFVDGKPVCPRFYYGSPPCLCEISNEQPQVFVIPFKADADTDSARVAIDAIDEKDTMWFSRARLVDVTEGTTNRIAGAQDEECTLHYAKGGLCLKKGHSYRYLVTHRAARFRTYFHNRVSYTDAYGAERVLPLPYGDTLGETVKLAGEAGVNLVTFSTGDSWGCLNWWAPPESPADYSELDGLCARLIAINPKVLLIPRISANAPEWLLKCRPDMRMKFDKGFTIPMSSVSCRDYRRAAVAEVGKLARHLQEKFPRNFAGLHVSGQNSAEWFYMLSGTDNLSGYDVHTRDAFRAWLAVRGEGDAATAEVPSAEERRRVRANFRFDPVKDRRVLDFIRFRQEEVVTLLNDFGAEIKRATSGHALALCFYGYTWELGTTAAGAGESGHFGVEWLLKNARGNIDGFSSPFSYQTLRWPGPVTFMSAAETIQRAGFLWINENDTRTHHEDIWDHMSPAAYDDPWRTRHCLLRDAASQILRGYGDWWMGLFGRGWFRDADLWQVRRELSALDRRMLTRSRPCTPEIAVVVNEQSLLGNGFGSREKMRELLERGGLGACGVTYGQYLLNDVLARPPDAKLYVFVYLRDLTDEQKKRLAAFKAKLSAERVLDVVSGADLTAEALAARAKRAGAHCYVEPGKADIAVAEGFVLVQALSDGPLEIDFGVTGPVRDALTGQTIGNGPRLTVPYRLGETRIFNTVCK